MPHPRHRKILKMLACIAGAACAFPAVAADAPALKDKSIGYVLTSMYWALYQSADGKAECAKGFNDGPREQYDVLFPKGKTRNMVDTQLKLEAQTWFPDNAPDPTPFKEAGGKLSFGMNLDGKVGPNDFVSPDGERGIDNQMFRALGCIVGFRGPDGIEFIFEPKEIIDSRFNRLVVELTGVDDLKNDSDVDVNLYRTIDRLLTDATGNNVIPGGSQRIDLRFGAPFMKHLHGRIVDGVLTTDPVDQITLPWTTLDAPGIQIIRGGRLRLRLTPTSAVGLIGGYTDIETWYQWLLRNDSTHHLSNGQISAISLHKALLRLADGYPDPKSSANTAISSALDVKFVQVFVQHPSEPAVTTAKSR